MILTTAIDAYVDRDRQAANFGAATKLWCRGTGSNRERYPLVFFSRPFPPGVTILSATLRVFTAEAWSGTQSLYARRITEAWKESRVNWNNRPATSATNEASVAASSLAAGAELELDVTALLADVSAGEPWFGFRLAIDANVLRALASAEHPNTALRPVLELEWSEAPEQPTSLAPAGGRAISKTKPLLTWAFTDRAGNTEQAQSRVQVSTSTDFSAPAYDSGWVANTAAQWDLSATAFAALADGAVRFWRVAVRDGAGLESAWSETQEFARQSHGSLAISNPDVPPANTVEETTPPIAWALTGRTQEQYQALLFRMNADGSATELARQARVTSAAVEWEIPRGLLRTGETYRVVVWVWDTVDRQAMAGDPDYVVLARDFTYVRSGTPAAVTALTATPEGAKVTLDFTRTSDPDYFALRVDGEEVFDRIEVADVFVSGDDYSFDYWLAQPNIQHTYELEAVVDDAGVLKHSDGNATATATTKPLGVWLADPLDSVGVLIAGKEKASMRIGEIAALHDVSGSRRPVRVMDTPQGYEGSFQGIVLEPADRDAFLELYGRQRTLRLIVGDLNLPVEIGEVSAIPSPIGERAGFDVSFAFWQVDEFEEAFEVAGG